MKNTFIIVILLLSVSCMGQIEGVNFDNAHLLSYYEPDDFNPVDGLFIADKFIDDSPIYHYIYSITPVCYKHCIDQLITILIDNDYTEHADYDGSLIPKYVNNPFNEYANISTAINAGSAELHYRWLLPNNWVIRLKSTDKIIGLSMWYEDENTIK